jgi:hypothetical protein
MGKEINPALDYSQGIKFRWPFPDDILHLFANPKSIKDIFFETFDKKTKSNIWINDPFPVFIQIQNTFFTILPKLLNRRLRYPQGNPRTIS